MKWLNTVNIIPDYFCSKEENILLLERFSWHEFTSIYDTFFFILKKINLLMVYVMISLLSILTTTTNTNKLLLLSK